MVPSGLDLHVMHYPGNLELSGKWKFTAKVQVNGTKRATQKASALLQNHVPSFYHQVLST